MSSNGRGRELSPLSGEDIDMPDESWLTNESAWDADRARRTVGFLLNGGRGRSLKFPTEAEVEGLWRPSLPAAGSLLELCRAGTGIGGAMLDALLPLSVLGL